MTARETIAELMDRLPREGCVEWIGVRPARDAPMQIVDRVELIQGAGLEGDRFSSRNDGPRQVTLIQLEHLAVIAACAGLETVEPDLLRRNIVVSGINLLALKDRRFRVGTALLAYSGQCHPCSKMERRLGPGGYNAVRGHGGITARVLESGHVRPGDPVAVEPRSSNDPGTA